MASAMEDFKGQKEEIFSKKIRAGKKRTYFIDVRSTRKSDYYITITESKRKHPESNEVMKHKLFLYKEDFNKFQEGLNEAIDYIKDNLLPEYDFEKFDSEQKNQTLTKDNFSDEEGDEETVTEGENEDDPSTFAVNFDEDYSDEQAERE
jgi:hypothetical protein